MMGKFIVTTHTVRKNVHIPKAKPESTRKVVQFYSIKLHNKVALEIKREIRNTQRKIETLPDGEDLLEYKGIPGRVEVQFSELDCRLRHYLNVSIRKAPINDSVSCGIEGACCSKRSVL